MAPRVTTTILKTSLLVVVSGWWLRDHIIETTLINGASMSPALSKSFKETGDRDGIAWLKWRPTDGLERGDVVLFYSPTDPNTYVTKRVIAMGGDEIRLDPRRQPGYGCAPDEMRPEDRFGSLRWQSWNGRLTVPPGHVWVEGDNWRHSKDSNDYGPISKRLIVGKAWYAVWPLGIFLTKPWEDFKTRTHVKARDDVLPEFWLE